MQDESSNTEIQNRTTQGLFCYYGPKNMLRKFWTEVGLSRKDIRVTPNILKVKRQLGKEGKNQSTEIQKDQTRKKKKKKKKKNSRKGTHLGFWNFWADWKNYQNTPVDESENFEILQANI